VNAPGTPSRRILLFTRAPRDEARSKRLSPRAHRLFGRLARSWSRAAAAAGAELEVSCPAADREELARLLGDRIRTLRSQTGETFGARLAGAIRDALGAGGAVLVVGGDVPAPDVDVVARAFAHLEAHAGSAVLEPSPDGGVNAIGLRQCPAALADGIRWGTPAVHGELAALFRAHAMPLLELAPRIDVDGTDAARTAARAGGSWARFAPELAAACVDRHADVPVVLIPGGNSHGRTSASRAPPPA